MFHALDADGRGSVSSAFLLGFLRRSGLRPRHDARLAGLVGYLRSANAFESERELSLVEFAQATRSCSTLLHKCITGALRVPDFEHFASVIERVFKDVAPNREGANADYIPQLKEVNPEQFAISVTTVDGQQFSVGDADTQFCIQSCSKPISYLMALRELGADYVHNHVGKEPSGPALGSMRHAVSCTRS